MYNHSFAVIAFGDSPYLSACIDSLKAQTVESKIYITTSTPSVYLNSIATKYNLEIFTTGRGNGIAHDWNFGLEQGKTKYVTLAHQDDIYDPDYTSSCIDALENFNDALICFTNYSEIINGKEMSNTKMLKIKRLMLKFFMPFKKNIRSVFWKKLSLSFGNAISCPTVTYNLSKLNDFRFSNDYATNLDWDAWYRIAKMEGRFVWVSKKLVQHRIHPDAATTEGIINKSRANEDLQMFKKFWPSFIARLLAKLYSASYPLNKTN